MLRPTACAQAPSTTLRISAAGSNARNRLNFGRAERTLSFAFPRLKPLAFFWRPAKWGLEICSSDKACTTRESQKTHSSKGSLSGAPGNRGLRGDRGFVLELFVCALSRLAGLRACSFDYAQDFGCWLERP